MSKNFRPYGRRRKQAQRSKQRRVNTYNTTKSNTVRTYLLITSNNKTLFLVKSAKNIKIMKVIPSKFKPFMLVTVDKDEQKEQHVVIVAGNTQVSPLEFKDETEAEQYLTEQPYEMFTNLYSIFKYYEQQEKEQPKKDIKEAVE